MDLASAPSAAREAHVSPALSEFVIRISFVIRHSGFVIQIIRAYSRPPRRSLGEGG